MMKTKKAQGKTEAGGFDKMKPKANGVKKIKNNQQTILKKRVLSPFAQEQLKEDSQSMKSSKKSKKLVEQTPVVAVKKGKDKKENLSGKKEVKQQQQQSKNTGVVKAKKSTENVAEKKMKKIKDKIESAIQMESNEAPSSAVQSKKKKPKRHLVLAPPKDDVENKKPKLAKDNNKPKGKKNDKSKTNVKPSTELAKSGQKSLQKRKTKKEKASSKKEVPTKAGPLSKMAKKLKFKKQQKLLKAQGKLKNKEKKPVEKTFEPLPFDEAKFEAILDVANIKKISKALEKLVQEEVAKKKTIFSDFRYLLDVSSFKIPNCPKRMVRLKLKHPLVDKDDGDDVLIVVPDLQRGSKVDYEPTIQHYEDLFREAGITGLKIMSFNQIRNEYNTFEAKRKLAATYDYFLCDGRISSHLAGLCGKEFQKPRTVFHSVRLDNNKNIKNEVEKSLRRTAFRQLAKGNMISIPVASHKHSSQQVAENVSFIIEQLKASHPGGLGNIQSLQLKISLVGTSSLPLYVSSMEPPAVTPNIIGPREQKMLQLKKATNEALTKFSLSKDGNIHKLTKKAIERKQQIKSTKLAVMSVNQADDEDDDDDDDSNDDDVDKEQSLNDVENAIEHEIEVKKNENPSISKKNKKQKKEKNVSNEPKIVMKKNKKKNGLA